MTALVLLAMAHDLTNDDEQRAEYRIAARIISRELGLEDLADRLGLQEVADA